jgi:hypothetical protein
VAALPAARPGVPPAAGGPLHPARAGPARLYPPGDADAAVGALRAVLGDERAAPAARRRAEAAFDAGASTRRLDAAIAAAIAARGEADDVTESS